MTRYDKAAAGAPAMAPSAAAWLTSWRQAGADRRRRFEQLVGKARLTELFRKLREDVGLFIQYWASRKQAEANGDDESAELLGQGIAAIERRIETNEAEAKALVERVFP